MTKESSFTGNSFNSQGSRIFFFPSCIFVVLFSLCPVFSMILYSHQPLFCAFCDSHFKMHRERRFSWEAKLTEKLKSATKVKLFSFPDKQFSDALINEELICMKMLIIFPAFKARKIKIIAEGFGLSFSNIK